MASAKQKAESEGQGFAIDRLACIRLRVNDLHIAATQNYILTVRADWS